MDITPKYLIMVEAQGNNHNKYYRMIPDDGGDTFTVEYGRVGSSCQMRNYPIYQWDKKYNEKIKKGYVDQTHLVEDLIKVKKPRQKSEYKKIEDAAIAEIVDRLMSMARQKVQQNYRVESNQVTMAMVDEAQKIIDRLVTRDSVKNFNDDLLELFTVIPRKMRSVNDHLSKDKDDFARIIKDEQDLLDVMRGQVVTHNVEEESTEEDDSPVRDETILEAMGITFEPVDKSEIDLIKSKLGDCKDKFYQAWRVTNLKTQKRFDDFVSAEKIKDCKLFWHGSRNENWWSIINTGLVLRPTNAVITGKMFGYGIYYAPKARKSLGYTSLNGSYWARGHSNSAFMALMNVAYGKPYDVHAFDNNYYDFNYDKLQKACSGANCLHAHAGNMLRNDEVIVYKEEQSTIKYLVELR